MMLDHNFLNDMYKFTIRMLDSKYWKYMTGLKDLHINECQHCVSDHSGTYVYLLQIFS